MRDSSYSVVAFKFIADICGRGSIIYSIALRVAATGAVADCAKAIEVSLSTSKSPRAKDTRTVSSSPAGCVGSNAPAVSAASKASENFY